MSKEHAVTELMLTKFLRIVHRPRKMILLSYSPMQCKLHLLRANIMGGMSQENLHCYNDKLLCHHLRRKNLTGGVR